MGDSGIRSLKCLKCAKVPKVIRLRLAFQDFKRGHGRGRFYNYSAFLRVKMEKGGRRSLKCLKCAKVPSSFAKAMADKKSYSPSPGILRFQKGYRWEEKNSTEGNGAD